MYETELLNMGLSDYKNKGISKLDSMENIDSIEIFAKRKYSVEQSTP